MPVPNSFANVTTSIPLSQLDANFNTPITLGNTAIQLGNTVTTLNNMTLANVTISSGNVTITNVSVTTANVTTANITTAIIGTANVTTANVTTGIIGTANVTTGNITTAIITTANVATANITTSQILNYGTANSVVYLNSSKAATANTGLQFDGTNLGLGVTPSNWGATYKAQQIGQAGVLAGHGSVPAFTLASNAYENSGWKAITTNPAQRIDLSSDNNATIFYRAASVSAGSALTWSESMRLDASGNLGIGTSTINTTLAVNGNALIGTGAWPTNDFGRSGSRFVNASSTEDGIFAIVNMQSGVAANRGGYLYLGARATTGVDGATFASIQGQRENATSGNYSSFLGFSTTSSIGVIGERARITSDGVFMVGSTDLANRDTTQGVYLGGGVVQGVRTSNATGDFGRLSTGGDIVVFRLSGTTQGSISGSGTTISYNSFAGSHWSQLQDGSKPEILRGTVMESINELCEWPDEPNTERLCRVKISDTEGSKKVYGVFMDWDNDWTATNDMLVTAVGAFVCRVNGSVTVQQGDLLESNGDGTARVQADDIIRSSTIGKVTCTAKTQEYDDGSYCVPTVLYCG